MDFESNYIFVDLFWFHFHVQTHLIWSIVSAFFPTKIDSRFFYVFQDVFLMIRRKKTTIFTDAKDSTSVAELKKMIEGEINRQNK